MSIEAASRLHSTALNKRKGLCGLASGRGESRMEELTAALVSGVFPEWFHRNTWIHVCVSFYIIIFVARQIL